MIQRLQQLFRQPPGALAHKFRTRLGALARSVLIRGLDRLRLTYGETGSNPLPPPLLAPVAGETLHPWAGTILPLAELGLEHRFDLLGSGWVQVRHGMSCRGLEGNHFPAEASVDPDPAGLWLQDRVTQPNLVEARKRWAMVEPGYVPIDWHLDFKSGYRWRETTWFRNIRFGHHPGMDVKVPWELSRLQHLPMLAYAFGLASSGHPEARPAQHYLREFESQVLDFLATNPPRFGVNWACTMDVGIRTANLVLAFELFRSLGATFSPAFPPIFQAAIRDHACHCAEHLEYDPIFRNNHYLADIAGLFWASAWLPTDAQSSAWLAFSLQELVAETLVQFHTEGSNFEASTSYHRLSTEMALTCGLLARILSNTKRTSAKAAALPARPHRPALRAPIARGYDLDQADPLPQAFWIRIKGALAFTAAITRPDGRIVQIGDNDSGRFLKLWPAMIPMRTLEAKRQYLNLSEYDDLPNEAIYWDEDILDHRALLKIGALITGDITAPGSDTPETLVIRALLAQGSQLAPAYTTAMAMERAACDHKLHMVIEQLVSLFGPPTETNISSPGIAQGLRVQAFPDFGLFLFRSDRLFFSIRAGSIGQRGLGGHAHNDQLSVELMMDGAVVLQDPGTYLYTPLPAARNYFRSATVHNVPGPDLPANCPPQRLFNYQGLTAARCIHLSPHAFAGQLPHAARVVRILPDALSILDFGPAPAPASVFHSPKYGALCITATTDNTRPPWQH